MTEKLASEKWEEITALAYVLTLENRVPRILRR
jgi:hypothetical protein